MRFTETRRLDKTILGTSCPPTIAATVALLGLVLLASTSISCSRPSDGASANESPRSAAFDHLSPAAWTTEQWQDRCRGVRTSFNPDQDLTDHDLTLRPGDPLWLDFVYWSLNNKIAEHQVEQYGGTGWDGPTGGVIFYWAPGSHWERTTLASFGFTIGHVIGEHRWLDTMFPDFFEPHGGVYGVNVKDRLVEIDPTSPTPWVEFLEHIGGPTSPYYRYLFHQESVVDPATRSIHLIGGQGVAFTYSFERYYHELREVLTDCRAVDYFEMRDLFGPGFASQGDWAGQGPTAEALAQVGYRSAGEARSEIYDPNPPAIDVPAGLPEAEAMERGRPIYLEQCAVCHGIRGDGQGFLADGFETKPRDFRDGVYKFRSTSGGELPIIADVERVVRQGVPGTTMPAWGQFLNDQQIADVSRYLVTMSEDFTEAWRHDREPQLLKLPNPPADLASLAPRGKAVWNEMQCGTCHGDDGRGGGSSAAALKDRWGHPIRATDLTTKWSFRNGFQPVDVYRTIVGGLNGTPMPAYSDALPDERDRWSLIAYILALSPTERPVLRLEDFKAQRNTFTAENSSLDVAGGR